MLRRCWTSVVGIGLLLWRHRIRTLCVLVPLTALLQGYIVFLAWDEPASVRAKFECLFIPLLVEAVIGVTFAAALEVVYGRAAANPNTLHRTQSVSTAPPPTHDHWKGGFGSAEDLNRE